MGFNCLKATERWWGGSLFFTTKFQEIPGTCLNDLRGWWMKGWVDLGATQGWQLVLCVRKFLCLLSSKIVYLAIHLQTRQRGFPVYWPWCMFYWKLRVLLWIFFVCVFFRVAITLIYFKKEFSLGGYVKLRGWYNRLEHMMM